MHCKALLDIGREVAQRAAVSPISRMVLIVTVQVPLVWRAKVTEVALNHRHGMVLYMLCVACLHVGHVVAFTAAVKLLLEMCSALMLQHFTRVRTRECAQRTLLYITPTHFRSDVSTHINHFRFSTELLFHLF